MGWIKTFRQRLFHARYDHIYDHRDKMFLLQKRQKLIFRTRNTENF